MNNKPLTTYRKLCTEFYDLEKIITTAEFAFYLDYAKKANGPVLEPMCGTGRFLIPMLQAGIDIEGFDASIYMLEALQAKYAQVSTKAAPAWQEFIQNFKNKQHYALIFIPFGSWGLITQQQEAYAGLQRLYNQLTPGGTLLLEIDTVTSVPEDLNIWYQRTCTRQDGSLLTINTLPSYDPTTQMFNCLCRYESIKHGHLETVEEERFSQYLYGQDELDFILQNVGFIHINKYQDYQKTLAQKDTPLIIYECIK